MTPIGKPKRKFTSIPLSEPIPRKPFDGSVAANVLAHGTGAINIDACRVEYASEEDKAAAAASQSHRSCQELDGVVSFAGRDPASLESFMAKRELGRWPANVVHDRSEDVLAAFPRREGSAARFFYSAKADDADRLGSRHPTVKPIALMRWLVRLVTPRGGLTLDPFAGTGTTGVAAIAERCRAILIEREAEYANDIRMRLAHARGAAPHTAQLKARKHRTAPKAGGLFAEETPSAITAEG